MYIVIEYTKQKSDSYEVAEAVYGQMQSDWLTGINGFYETLHEDQLPRKVQVQ